MLEPLGITLLEPPAGPPTDWVNGLDENCADGNEPIEIFEVTMEVPADAAAPIYGFVV